MRSRDRHQGHVAHDRGVRRTTTFGRGAEGARAVGCSQPENLRVAHQWSRLRRSGKRAVVTAPDRLADTARMPCGERVGGAAEAAVSKCVFLGVGSVDLRNRRRAGASHIAGGGRGGVVRAPCRQQASVQCVPLVVPLLPLDLRRGLGTFTACATRLLMRGERTWSGGRRLGQEAQRLLRGSRPGRRVLLRHGGEGSEDAREEKNENEQHH